MRNIKTISKTAVKSHRGIWQLLIKSLNTENKKSAVLKSSSTKQKIIYINTGRIMKKNKKLLISFLAINAILPSYGAAASASLTTKYDRMYNSIVKSIDKGSSSEKN